MPIAIEVKADIKQATRSLDRVQRRVVPKATYQALNRTASTVRTRVRRRISTFMNIAQKHLKDSLSIEKASRNRLVARVWATGRSIPLIHFKGTRQLKAGVVSRVHRQRVLRKGTFTAATKKGHRGAFRRIGGRRGPPPNRSELPIVELVGPSVAQTVARKEIVEEMKKTARERFAIEFRRALNFGLSRLRR